jgi:hypothetical protein
MFVRSLLQQNRGFTRLTNETFRKITPIGFASGFHHNFYSNTIQPAQESNRKNGGSRAVQYAMLTSLAGVGATLLMSGGSASAEGNDESSPYEDTKLYPAIKPYEEGHLEVSDIHSIYFAQYGNPEGKPVVFVHGGPGGGTAPLMARYFDPKVYRIILVDQRGCGLSTPFADLRDNTTWDLVEDFEKLRKRLGIDKWQVFGGSWGSTLSLSYAVSSFINFHIHMMIISLPVSVI